LSAEQDCYMLDTNTVSRILRKDSVVLNRRIAGMRMDRLCISSITEAELYYGLEKNPSATALRAAVEAFLIRVDTMSWSSGTARVYAKLRASSESRGITIGNLDLLIASHAIETNAILVTNDRALQSLNPWLAVEDWTAGR
jgi:tRNA(fMet)-specific endonuclease VapC